MVFGSVDAGMESHVIVKNFPPTNLTPCMIKQIGYLEKRPQILEVDP